MFTAKMVNRYKPHVLILSEDEATHDIANGFYLSLNNSAAWQILEPAGGVPGVKAQLPDLIKTLDRFREGFLVIIIDFDNRGRSRYDELQREVPNHLVDRVFILGCATEAETLRGALVQENRIKPNSWETIGEHLFRDCARLHNEYWVHPQLQHNHSEIVRVRGALQALIA